MTAIYPAVWGISQLGADALSDRVGCKPLITLGMIVQAGGIFLFILTADFWMWALGSTLLGPGTALVYPTLLDAIGDVAHRTWHASAVGVYRLWRDGGYAIGALLAGSLADALGIRWAIGAAGGRTLLSGIIVTTVMCETLPGRRCLMLRSALLRLRARPHLRFAQERRLVIAAVVGVELIANPQQNAQAVN